MTDRSRAPTSFRLHPPVTFTYGQLSRPTTCHAGYIILPLQLLFLIWFPSFYRAEAFLVKSCNEWHLGRRWMGRTAAEIDTSWVLSSIYNISLSFLFNLVSKISSPFQQFHSRLWGRATLFTHEPRDQHAPDALSAELHLHPFVHRPFLQVARWGA